jgi:transcription antitermination factor NusG
MKGDAVIVIKGDLKNLEGWVEKVEDETVHIKPKISDLPVFNCIFSFPYCHGIGTSLLFCPLL